jgi:hypothetical protein
MSIIPSPTSIPQQIESFLEKLTNFIYQPFLGVLAAFAGPMIAKTARGCTEKKNAETCVFVLRLAGQFGIILCPENGVKAYKALTSRERVMQCADW